VDPINRYRLCRCLVKASSQDYHRQISQACFENVQGGGLTLVLYEITTLYFEIQEEDEYPKPGLSKEHRFPLGQQSGGTRYPHDESEAKNIRLFSLKRRRRPVLPDPWLYFNGSQE
jgi:hypothetical protein